MHPNTYLPDHGEWEAVNSNIHVIILIVSTNTLWAVIAQPVYDSLRTGRSGDRIPVGARYSASIHTGPGAYPASCTVGTVSFPGVKQPGRGVDHPPHLALRLKKE